MALTNISKPTTSFTNINKTSSGETWATILTTWLAETRTWATVGSFLGNITKISSSITNLTKAS